jgi:integrase
VGGCRHSKRFARRVDAEAWLCENGAAIGKGSWIHLSAGKITFDVYAEAWRSSQVFRPTTAEQGANDMRNHIIPAFTGRPIGSIRTSEVQSWVKGLSHQLSPGTVEVVFRYFASVCRSAVRDRFIAFNPSEGIKLPKQETVRIAPLEAAEVRVLIDGLPDGYRAAATLGAGAGLRQGEIFGLTVDRVDFPRRTLTVDRRLLTVTNRPAFLGPQRQQPTSGGFRYRRVSSSRSPITLPRFLQAPEGFMFTTEDGAPLPPKGNSF